MAAVASIPRLSLALRSFASSTSSSYEDRNENDADLFAKRQLLLSSSSGPSLALQKRLSWRQIVATFKAVVGPEKNELTWQRTNNDLQTLLTECRGLLHDEAETVASYCFYMLADRRGVCSPTDVADLKRTFGILDLSSAKLIHIAKIVHELVNEIADDSELLRQRLLIDQETNGEEVSSPEFGTKIRIQLPSMKEPSMTDDFEAKEMQLLDRLLADLLGSKGEAEKEQSMTFEHVSLRDQPGPKQPRPPSPEFEELSPTWLREQVSNVIPDKSLAQQIAQNVLDLLVSNRSSDDLQSQLLDLIGYDGFDLIGQIINRRQEIVDKANKKSAKTLENLGVSLKETAKVPRGAGGVSLITKEDLEYERAVKKANAAAAKESSSAYKQLQEVSSKSQATSSTSFTESKLLKSLIGANISSIPLHRFPYVFDALSEVQRTASFIANVKLFLPIGCIKREFKTYDELEVPPVARPSSGAGSESSHIRSIAGVGDPPISVSQLEPWAQKAFAGTKKLNKIQTVVFDSAFNTNQNLLICAPTGAGKTNIAMLAILHEIDQNRDDITGRIQLDNFKIVYVAPMKALASEMTSTFGKRLSYLGVEVRELTGDMQLSRSEIARTQMIVTTPEKWDVITRKAVGDTGFTHLVRLIIFDEVHLLADERGPVIETLVARTLRQVETSQNMIRLIGLSATLPNYIDVARFLHVTPTGLFFFDGRFRPVPLTQVFIGVKSLNRMHEMVAMNEICYDKTLALVKEGHQVMIFVHARNETIRTATALREIARNAGQLELFRPESSKSLGEATRIVNSSKNRNLRELFPDGFGMHNAGMLRHDRNLVERYFGEGFIRVLVCTATLAWGVNLPAHAVIIKGTQIYDAQHGTFVDLGLLDVMQIFGRAGRPQFDTSGIGMIMTSYTMLSHYLSLLTQQHPIESRFIECVADNLNAEIALCTVTNVEEGIKWLQDTYYYTRLRSNPLAYGLTIKDLEKDPTLYSHLNGVIVSSASKLEGAKMIRFARSQSGIGGDFSSTDLGRIASHFYIKYDTVEIINKKLDSVLTDADAFDLIANAEEFKDIKVREEEMEELDRLAEDGCQLPIKGGMENTYGKVNILLQAFVSVAAIDSFSLVSDMSYVSQNAARIARALFEISLRSGSPLRAACLLTVSRCLERQLWPFENPLRQFSSNALGPEIFQKLTTARLNTVDKIRDTDPKEIGAVIRHPRNGPLVHQLAMQMPRLDVQAQIQPITRQIVRIRLTLRADFHWSDKAHLVGSGEPFWIWIEDPDHDRIYHHEYVNITKKQVLRREEVNLVFAIPLAEPLPSQYLVKVAPDRWLGCDTTVPISFKHLMLPDVYTPYTELLPLMPLPVTALGRDDYQRLYKYSHFNPIQTQVFHTLYHSDCNVLVGAPTGSGKTICAEFAVLRVFRTQPKMKVVYIAPLKALVRERMNDWKERFEGCLKGRTVVEMTGDVTPDMRALMAADVIVTTPEKWDGISRSWQTRSYVQSVALIIIDEIHLLGDDRGPVLEVIVSRTNFITSHTSAAVRVVGLSTALANATDLACWLNVPLQGLFNFRPSVRPVPLVCHISGFPGKHYCPRMGLMNKPAFQAIRQYSMNKPSLIFVSSRRQTRLTAMDLIAFLAVDGNPKQWVHMPEDELDAILQTVKDPNMKLTLSFGIALHHAGLHESDRKVGEQLFSDQKIQVLIATATLAWGINLPAHLVIIKGTEYYDGKQCRYVDMPITDVLQMMGRAGRPQYDQTGTCVIFVQDLKKDFYKKFIYESFPVESCLLGVFADHLNAEIVANTVSTRQDCIDYITWTYFFRRLIRNPTYYGVEDVSPASINRFLSNLVSNALTELAKSGCIRTPEDGPLGKIESTFAGQIASFYYVRHETLRLYQARLLPGDLAAPQLLQLLADSLEYSTHPVRHNEDNYNSDLAKLCPFPVSPPESYDSPHTKTFLLLQSHFYHIGLPIADYVTDQKSVLDQAIRLLQAMLDVVADRGQLANALTISTLIQCVVQGRWFEDDPLMQLPHVVNGPILSAFRGRSLPELIATYHQYQRLDESLSASERRYSLDAEELDHVRQALYQMPIMAVKLALLPSSPTSSAKKIGSSSASPSFYVPVCYPQTPISQREWIQVLPESEYILSVSLSRLNRSKRTGQSMNYKVYAPAFSKPKDEGWILIIGDCDRGDLVALRKVQSAVRMAPDATKLSLAFVTPATIGRKIFTFYVMSDGYLGLDQQYDLCLDIVPSTADNANSNKTAPEEL